MHAAAYAAGVDDLAYRIWYLTAMVATTEPGGIHSGPLSHECQLHSR